MIPADPGALWFWLATYLAMGGGAPAPGGVPLRDLPPERLPRGARSRRERELVRRATTWGFNIRTTANQGKHAARWRLA